MRLWVDILNASDIKLDPGPVRAISASVRRALDGAGNISFEVPGTDERALSLVINERRARINIEQLGTIRELGRGIVRKTNARDGTSGWQLSASGPDSLDELRRRNCWLGRTYNAQTIQTIVDDLIALVPGWAVTVDSAVAGNLKSMRADGDSVLKALQALVAEEGLHLREGTTARTLEIGAFGQSVIDSMGTTFRVINASQVPADLYSNDAVALIESFTLARSSEAVANRIVVLGAGEGEAALTLQNCTLSSPYTAKSMIVNSKTQYYIEDQASIDLYGVIEKVVTFKRIVPIANSAAAKTAAANALYTAAAAWLQRNAFEQETYSVSVRKGKLLIRPGDKIRLTYKGLIRDKGKLVTYRDIDTDFWVLSAGERIGQDGISLDLQVSNIDQHQKDIAQVIVGAIEDIQVRNLKVQTYPFFSSETTQDFMQGFADPSSVNYKPARFKLEIDNAVTDLTRVLIRIKTYPLYSLISFDSAVFKVAATPIDLIYQIYVSPNYPQNIHLSIDGVDVTTALGGPWNTGGSARTTPTNIELDITDYIVNAPGGLYMEHDLNVFDNSTIVGDFAEVYPGSPLNDLISNGVVQMNIRVFGTAQSIIVN